jgi:hypothetical protein
MEERTMNNLLTRKLPFATALLLLALGTSCSHEPAIEKNQNPDNNVHEWQDSTIDGNATMSRMAFSVGKDTMFVKRIGDTRGTNAVDGQSYTFDANELITISISNNGVKDYKVSNTSTGALSYNGASGGEFFWKHSNELVSAWSYGNTTKTTTDPDNAVYTLNTNQSSNYGELLYSPATTYGYATYSAGIPLTLYHQMVRVVINLTHLKDGDLNVSEIYIGDGSTATIPTTAKFHKPTTGNVGTWDNIGTEKGKITPKTEVANSCYSAVLIPATYPSGQKFIVIKTTDSRTYCYTPDASITLAAGTQYNYTISVKDLKQVSTLTIGDIAAYTYDGTAKEPTPTVTDGTKTLTKDTDYTLSYSNNTNAGTATVTVTGIGGYYTGTQSKNFAINKATPTWGSWSNSTSYVNVGSTFTRTISLTGINSTALTVSYSASSGVATVNSSSGLVTGVSVGDPVTITASYAATTNYNAVSQTYTVSVGKPLSNATSADVGKIICSNKHMHNHVNSVESGAVASAMIAYVGSAGSVDASSSTYKGLAISISDANSGNTCNWSTDNPCSHVRVVDFSTSLTDKHGIEDTNTLVSISSHVAARNARNYATARPSGVSAWFLPSMGQWNMIVKALTGSSEDLQNYPYLGDTYKPANVNPKITAAGANGFKNSHYWSCVGISNGSIFQVAFNRGGATIDGPSTNYYYVRPVFAF